MSIEEIISPARVVDDLQTAEIGDHVVMSGLAGVFMADEATMGDRTFIKHKHVGEGTLYGWTWERTA